MSAYSDHQGLVRRLTEAFEDAWPRIEAAGRKKQARLSVPRDADNPKGPRVTGVFKYGSPDRLIQSPEARGSLIIQLGTGTGKVYTQTRFVHEAVHAAQRTLGLLDDMNHGILEMKRLWEAQGGRTGIDQHDFYYHIAHEDMWFEHEANTVSLLEHLRLGDIKGAYEQLIYDGMYLRYPKDTVLQWADQHGVGREVSEGFIESIPTVVDCLLDRIAGYPVDLNSAIAVRQLVYPMIMVGMDPMPAMKTALACVDRFASESKIPIGMMSEEFRMEVDHLRSEGKLPPFTRARLSASERMYRLNDLVERLEASKALPSPGM